MPMLQDRFELIGLALNGVFVLRLLCRNQRLRTRNVAWHPLSTHTYSPLNLVFQSLRRTQDERLCCRHSQTGFLPPVRQVRRLLRLELHRTYLYPGRLGAIIGSAAISPGSTMMTDVLSFSSVGRSLGVASVFKPAAAITQITAPEITGAMTSRPSVSLMFAVADNAFFIDVLLFIVMTAPRYCVTESSTHFSEFLYTFPSFMITTKFFAASATSAKFSRGLPFTRRRSAYAPSSTTPSFPG